MGYDLQGPNGALVTMNSSAWVALLDGARRHGWIPMGTERGISPEELAFDIGIEDTGEHNLPAYTGESSRGYWSNDNHIVTEEDARNLGTALRAYRSALVRVCAIVQGLELQVADQVKVAAGLIVSASRRHGNGEISQLATAEEIEHAVAPVRDAHPWLYHLTDAQLAILIDEADERWIARVGEVIALCDNGRFAIA